MRAHCGRLTLGGGTPEAGLAGFLGDFRDGWR